MVTAHCGTCGEVDLDEIIRTGTRQFIGDLVIETISVKCLRCGGTSSSDYTHSKTSWLRAHGYTSVSEQQPVKKARGRRGQKTQK